MAIIVPFTDTPEAMIQYLTMRKFPLAFPMKELYETGRRLDAHLTAAEKEKVRADADAYREKLHQKSREELERMCAVERPKEQKEKRIKAEKEEKDRYFNQPDADADFDFWSKAAYWTLDEAVALSLGKDPKKVKWDDIKSLIDRSPFIQGYGKRRDLANRAKTAGQIKEPTPPSAFVEWSQENDLSFPQQLAEKVKARMKKTDATVPTPSAPAKPKANELKTREKDTLLKLVIGMAVAGYRYDPKATKNQAVTDITDDLAKLGLSLDADTVRRWLKEAASMLPGKPDKT